MSRSVVSRLLLVVALVAALFAGSAATAAAAAADGPTGTIVRLTERGPLAVGAVTRRSEQIWRVVRPTTGAASTTIACRAGLVECGLGDEELRASCATRSVCALDAEPARLRDAVPFEAVRGPAGWSIRDRRGVAIGQVTDLPVGTGAVALLAAAAVLCPESADRLGRCFDPRREIAREQRAAARKQTRFVPLGTHGLVYRYHVLSWNFVAQVEIDGEDEESTVWRVDHTHPQGLAPGRGRVSSSIACRTREAAAGCAMNGPAVTDLRATCSRPDRCELVADGRSLRRKVPATATRGPLNWIVRDSDGNRLGRVGKLGKGYPDGAVALLAAATMLCPEAAADYVGCPSPFATSG